MLHYRREGQRGACFIRFGPFLRVLPFQRSSFDVQKETEFLHRISLLPTRSSRDHPATGKNGNNVFLGTSADPLLAGGSAARCRGLEVVDDPRILSVAYIDYTHKSIPFSVNCGDSSVFYCRGATASAKPSHPRIVLAGYVGLGCATPLTKIVKLEPVYLDATSTAVPVPLGVQKLKCS